MRRLRICRVIARLNVGGAAVHVIQLTSGLDSERFEQLVVTGVESPGEASMLPEAQRRGLAPLIIPELGREVSVREDMVTLAKLCRLFRSWKPDIVETHTAKAGTLGRLAALLARVPVRVHVFHGHVFHGYFSPAKSRIFVQIERALARISTRIVALGEVQRQEILSYGVGTPEKVVSIPLGFELAPFLEAERRRGTLRAELGLPVSGGSGGSGVPLIGIAGRLFPIKAHEVFLTAAARALAEEPEAHFVVVGGGEREAELRALASQPPLAGHVHFLGWRGPTEMPAAYADLDVFTLTSDNEGMPVTIIEAMAAARPVVATDVGGVRNLVHHGVTGLLAPKRDAGAISDAWVRLLRDPDLRRRMGRAGREAVYPRLDVSTLLRTMTDFYTDLAPSP